MEILFETANYGVYYFGMTVISLLIASTLFVIAVSIRDFLKRREQSVKGILFQLIILWTLSVLGFKLFSTGAQTACTAYVYDINEVYENGYKIVGQNEGIFTLVKIK